MLFAFNFSITYMYIHNFVHIIFKIWYIIIILSYFLLCAVHLMQGFIYQKMLQGNQNYSQDRSFLKGNEENPALELSNIHNRTSARDGPMFGYKGLSSVHVYHLPAQYRLVQYSKYSRFHWDLLGPHIYVFLSVLTICQFNSLLDHSTSA